MSLSLTYRGFNYVSYYNGGYVDADSLADLAQTGANSAALDLEYGINVRNSTVYTDANYTDSLTTLGNTITEAVNLGLSVMVKPLIDFLDPAKIGSNDVGDWRAYFNPTNPSAFFSSYKTMIVGEAQVAQAHGAALLSIGTELDQLTGSQYLSYWTDIISSVRAVFSGKLTYSAIWDDAISPWQGHNGLTAGTGNLATQVSFWSQLDYVGLDVYAPLSDAADPTLADLIAGWTQVPTEPVSKSVTGNQSLISYFEGVAAQIGKPLLFTEIGYESATDAALEPAGSSTNVFDPQLQADLYTAFFEAWKQAGNSSLQGVYFWVWDPNTSEVGPGNGANFSPQGLPAEDVIKANFSNRAPVAAITDHSLHTNQWSQLASWISYSDADGNAATQYQFWDDGTAANSGYFWTPDNPHNAANSPITVAASDLDDVWVRGGQTAGAETMWVRAFDGTDWSAWDSFTLTTLPNHPPVAAIADHSVNHNEWAQVKNWLSVSDADGDAIKQYQFWDDGTAANSGYFWTPDNAHNAANSPITVAASDLNNVWVRGGQAASAETMWVRAFDGTDWSAWDSFTFTTLPNHAPVATIADHSVHTNEWTPVKNWLSVSDADADAIKQYQFWDDGTAANSGYFWTPDNAHNAANIPITVAASELDNVWVRGGQTGGAETMWVRAFDGTEWSAWDSFTFTTLPNHAPVAAIADHSLHLNEWAQVKNWLSVSDADGDAIRQYQFWDDGLAANSGYFWTSDNPHNAANSAITVAASDLDNVWVRGGQAAGAETMWVRAFDGTDWSAWTAFHLTSLL